MQQEDKLQKWHEGLGEVNGWVVKTRVKVEAQQRLATDVDAALEQLDDFQVCCCCCCCVSILVVVLSLTQDFRNGLIILQFLSRNPVAQRF